MYTLLSMLRRKERLALLMLGILLVSFASGLAAATARSTQGTIDEELARQWRTDYDLLIRHPSAVSDAEKHTGSILGNYQANLSETEGITFEQLEVIRSIPGVEVAAPLTVIGPARFISAIDWHLFPLDYGELPLGFYREEITITERNGIEELETVYVRHFMINPRLEEQAPADFPLAEIFHQEEIGWRTMLELLGLIQAPPHIPYMGYFLVVAVDFDAECLLYGLDEAMVSGVIPAAEASTLTDYRGELAVAGVFSTDYRPQGQVSVRVSRLKDMLPDGKTLLDLWEKPTNWLASQPATLELALDLDLAEEFQYLPAADLAELAEKDFLTYGKDFFANIYRKAPKGFNFRFDGERTYALATATVLADSDWNWGGGELRKLVAGRPGAYFVMPEHQAFKAVAGNGYLDSILPLINTGYFDPSLLAMEPPDAPVAAPLAIYRRLPDSVGGTQTRSLHPYDFGTPPASFYISIDCAEGVFGMAAIDSIRVKVSGVEDMSERSQVRIAAIAQRIREQTGLHVDIVLGSSLQTRDVHLYSYDSPGRREYRQRVAEVMENEITPKLQGVTGMRAVWGFVPNLNQTLDRVHDSPNTIIVNLPSQLAQPNQDIEAEWNLIRPWLEQDLMRLIPGVEAVVPVFDGLAKDEIAIGLPDYKILPHEERPLYGIVTQYWVQIGTALRIYHETNRGTFWITMGLLMVGALFIGNTTYISAVGRTSEFATLRSLGWRRGTVFRASLSETLIISLTAGVVTAGVLAAIWHFSDRYLEPWLLLVLVPAVVVTFLIGSIPPLIRTLFISPLQGVRRGELKTTTRLGGARPIGFILRGLIARPGRTFVTALAMIFPAGTLAIMFFIYFGIQALLGETLLGEYLAVELRGYHFVLNALIFAVAGLAVTDTLLINLRERQKEFGILKAIGWKNRTVAGLLLWEGVGLGLLSGVIGTVIAGVLYTKIFAMLPPDMWVNGPLLAVVPALVAGLAAIVPALRAARIPAAQVIREE